MPYCSTMINMTGEGMWSTNRTITQKYNSIKCLGLWKKETSWCFHWGFSLSVRRDANNSAEAFMFSQSYFWIRKMKDRNPQYRTTERSKDSIIRLECKVSLEVWVCSHSPIWKVVTREHCELPRIYSVYYILVILRPSAINFWPWAAQLQPSFFCHQRRYTPSDSKKITQKCKFLVISRCLMPVLGKSGWDPCWLRLLSQSLEFADQYPKGISNPGRDTTCLTFICRMHWSILASMHLSRERV